MNFMTRVWRRLLQEWWQLSVPIRLRSLGVDVGTGVRFYGMPIVSLTKGSRISIGDRVVLCSDSRFTDLGVNHPVVLRTLRAGAGILIGNDVGMSGGAICAAVRVSIGNECLIGANVTIADTDFHAVAPAGRRFNGNQNCISVGAVAVGNNVFIGTQSVILKGVTIGDNSIIGANSLVAKGIPVNVIAGGHPAHVIKNIP